MSCLKRICLFFHFIYTIHVTQSQSFDYHLLNVNSCRASNSPLLTNGDAGKYFDFISGGLKRLFWSHDWQEHFQINYNINKQCIKSVIYIQSELMKGSSSAFSMVDASSSTASGFLSGSFSSLGDFDQCFKLKINNKIDGNYCLIEIAMKNETLPQNVDTVDGHLRSIVPLLGFFLPRMSLCLPHQCSQNDVLHMTRYLLQDYPFKVTDKISCQNERARARRSPSKLQISSLILISIMFTLSLTGTVIKYLTPDIDSTLTRIFSFQRHLNELFYRSTYQVSRHRGIDKLKVTFSLMFISMHAIGGSDNPYSPLILSNMLRALEDASKAYVQFLFSENLAEVMFMLTGYVTVTSIVSFVSRAKENKSTLNMMICFMFSKWLRTMPLVVSLMALEFIWPLMSTGPMYPEASAWLVNNCYKYWWTNILLIANWFPSIDKCCPQLFHSCVDFQLTLIAITLLMLLKKSIRLGISIAIILSFASMVKLYHNAYKYSVIPNYVSNGATIHQRMLFMDTIQLPTYSHVPAYLMGVICAYKSITRTIIKIPPVINRIASYTCYCASLAAAFAPALHNSFNILTQPFVPIYIVLQKIFFIALLLPILLPVKQQSSSNKTTGMHRDSGNISTQQHFDLLGCLSKLTFCSYLINFYVIRYDFMIARIPFEHGIHSANKRFVFSVLNTYIASFIFYLIFAGPFEEIRKIICNHFFFRPQQQHSQINQQQQQVLSAEKSSLKQH